MQSEAAVCCRWFPGIWKSHFIGDRCARVSLRMRQIPDLDTILFNGDGIFIYF